MYTPVIMKHTIIKLKIFLQTEDNFKISLDLSDKVTLRTRQELLLTFSKMIDKLDHALPMILILVTFNRTLVAAL